ncbi:hypothetical protein Tco_0458701 [Tanacetum coccineum]|uniref:Uncharacterized protein n=1 Tax=Tanacetum coccineum TaxID=301880 RepID=A0ABQ5GXW4_9ASTR
MQQLLSILERNEFRCTSQIDFLNKLNFTHYTIGYRLNSDGNMEMEPDIENMTMSEYLEYEAVKVRRLWDDVRSRRSPTHYYEADFALLYRNKVILFISICLDSPPPTDSILS